MDSEATERLRARLDGGLVAAVPVPFDREGRLHEGAHESYVRYVASQPVAGVAVWAHTGRGLMLVEETARRVLSDWRAALPQSVVVAGAGSRRADGHARATEDSVAMAARAAELGADAVLAYAPVWLRGHERRDELMVEHHRRLASVGLPLILFYLYEEAGGVRYSAAVLDELLSMPEVVGIKMATLDSVMTYQDVSRQLLARHPDKLLITGEDRFLGYSLMRGARSALVGMGAVCCELQADLIRAHAGGNAARFLLLSAEVDALAESLFVRPMEGYIRRVLWALSRLGVIPEEAAHDPWGPALDARELEEIGRRLEALAGARTR
ncbi:MAG TPA: dihydrodipicolinate synthase family protein [Pyrinomonadaceae bacterium]|nr:dihydrodipicolinate synthase family protein [Pyrinomonadaceae bacterium]